MHVEKISILVVLHVISVDFLVVDVFIDFRPSSVGERILF
jgi:hypothetical protein